MVDIQYKDKLESEATPPDDVEGLLYNFIPADYTKSTFEFDRLVDTDATAFKPLGEKISSYVRAAAVEKPKGKGKAKANGKAVDHEMSGEDEKAVVYEAYKVSWALLLWLTRRRRGIHLVLGNIIVGCSCSYCFSSREVVISR